MNPQASQGLFPGLLTRWITDDPAIRVIEATWAWQPRWPAWVLLVALAILWLAVVAVHRSRRMELSTGWRVGLGLLRAAILAMPVLMLMQPQISARLERQEPRTLAILLDHSGSMSLKDGPEQTPSSRWQRVTESYAAAMAAIGGSLGDGRAATGISSAEPGRVRVYLFDERARGSGFAPGASAGAGRTAIGEALREVHSDLAGAPTAGIVLVTDGADNASPAGCGPLEAARELARAGIPVHACLAGNEHPRQAAISLVTDAPFAFVGDPVRLRVGLEHHGFDHTVATVTLLDGDRTVDTRAVVLPAGGQPAVERFEIRPAKPGRTTCRAELTPLPGELTTADNLAAAHVRVIDQPIRVLYVERWPRWQYRFLVSAIRRDHRFEPRLVLLTEDPAGPPGGSRSASFPASAQELSQFDVVVLGELAPADLSPRQWQWLHDHVVEDGAGVVFIAGPMHMPASFVDSPVEPLLPFARVVPVPQEQIEEFQPALTPLGRHHPLMRLGSGEDVEGPWQGLPGLQWYAGVADLKPGAVVLAEGPAGPGGEPTPLIIVQRVGRGSVLFVGTDETWKWRYQIGNRYFYGFWAHAMQHVGLPHRVGELGLFEKDTYDLFTGGYEARGDAVVEASPAGGLDPELADTGVRPALLRQIADVTGGRFLRVEQLPQLIEGLDLSPLRYQWSQRIPLWDGWAILCILAALLTVEWVLRKWRYLP